MLLETGAMSCISSLLDVSGGESYDASATAVEVSPYIAPLSNPLVGCADSGDESAVWMEDVSLTGYADPGTGQLYMDFSQFVSVSRPVCSPTRLPPVVQSKCQDSLDLPLLDPVSA